MFLGLYRIWATGSYLALAKLAEASDFLAPAIAALAPAKTPYIAVIGSVERRYQRGQGVNS